MHFRNQYFGFPNFKKKRKIATNKTTTKMIISCSEKAFDCYLTIIRFLVFVWSLHVVLVLDWVPQSKNVHVR